MPASGKPGRLVRCAVFFFLLLLLVIAAGHVLRTKNREILSESYFDGGRGDHDVILLGPSTIMNGVYPPVLWNRFGFTAYNLGAGNESALSSCYLAQYAIRKDHPKLIVYDCGLLRKEKVVDSVSFLHFVTDVLPMTLPERWALLLELAVRREVGVLDTLQLFFPVLTYHARWEELSERDFSGDEKAAAMGAKVDRTRLGRKNVRPVTPYAGDGEGYLPEHSEEELRRLIRICRDSGTELLLVTMPLTCKTRYFGQEDYEARVDAAAAVTRIAEEEGITHLNLINDGAAFGLSAAEDTVEGYHLNVYGAEKFTAFLGSYIAEHTDVEDRRGDESLAFLDEAYREFAALVESRTGGYVLKE